MAQFVTREGQGGHGHNSVKLGASCGPITDSQIHRVTKCRGNIYAYVRPPPFPVLHFGKEICNNSNMIFLPLLFPNISLATFSVNSLNSFNLLLFFFILLPFFQVSLNAVLRSQSRSVLPRFHTTFWTSALFATFSSPIVSI